jgi:hypothetical protein
MWIRVFLKNLEEEAFFGLLKVDYRPGFPSLQHCLVCGKDKTPLALFRRVAAQAIVTNGHKWFHGAGVADQYKH